MALLAAKNYDPATAVLKACTAAIAMTALDTTNLRNTFTVPASGKVFVRLACSIHGGSAAPWLPSILLGLLQSTTVVARQPPMTSGGHLAATTLWKAEAGISLTGLTPGASLTWDAAYGVETIVTGANIKYGGPNDTTANNAFGAFLFEVWEA